MFSLAFFFLLAHRQPAGYLRLELPPVPSRSVSVHIKAAPEPAEVLWSNSLQSRCYIHSILTTSLIEPVNERQGLVVHRFPDAR